MHTFLFFPFPRKNNPGRRIILFQSFRRNTTRVDKRFHFFFPSPYYYKSNRRTFKKRPLNISLSAFLRWSRLDFDTKIYGYTYLNHFSDLNPPAPGRHTCVFILFVFTVHQWFIMNWLTRKRKKKIPEFSVYFHFGVESSLRLFHIFS